MRVNLNYDFEIDWGDGSPIEHYTLDGDSSKGFLSTSDCIHNYEKIGTYRVNLYGEVPILYGANNKSSRALIESLRGVLVSKGYVSPLKYAQYMFFGCEKLEYLGSGVLGKNMKNCRSLAHMFDGAKIKKIPDNTLYYCENVVDASYIFEACSIEELPEKLFSSCTKLKNLNHAFHRCDYLKEIPDGLLDSNTELETIVQCFQGCPSLESIPTDLFDNCKKLKDVRLAIAGETIFTNIYGDKHEKITGTLPALWDRTDLPYGGVVDIDVGEGNTKKWYEGYAGGCINAQNYDIARAKGWA